MSRSCSRKYRSSFATVPLRGSFVVPHAIFEKVRTDTPLPLATEGHWPLEA